MSILMIHGVSVVYEVIGHIGPWMTLSPGGRRDMDDVRSLGRHISERGYRVVIFDRRNCGRSDISIDASQPEHLVWVDDLSVLLDEVGAQSAIVGGGSSGCRLSLRFALKYPQRVKALFLYRITGGQFATNRLAKKYYSDFVDAAHRGGMAAVCETEHFASLITARPEQRDALLAMDANRFIDAMSSWEQQFITGAAGPIIGATVEELQSVNIPTLIIPGNDRTHNHAVAETTHQHIQGSEYVDLYPGDLDRDITPMHEWASKEAQMAQIFDEFARRRTSSSKSS